MHVATNQATALAKSDLDIALENAAGLLLSASRIIVGAALPNFKAVVSRYEISFAQKQSDIATVEKLLLGENAVVPMLEKAADAIQTLRAHCDAVELEPFATFEIPAKPLPEGSPLRDAIRRLRYVQSVARAVARWLCAMGESEALKRSALYVKTQRDLLNAFQRVIVQIHQAAIVMGKYREMGDIQAFRDLTLDAEAMLNDLRERSRRIAETRKSIPLFERAIAESGVSPTWARRGASILGGAVVVIALSFGIVKLWEFASPTPSESAVSSPSQPRRVEAPANSAPERAPQPKAIEPPTPREANSQSPAKRQSENRAIDNPRKDATTNAPSSERPLGVGKTIKVED
ncbi:MAG: hypothetical protein NZM06_04940 [Chloroherpetonaceae bacterium]|nr:hypothetical protein [Chloroherpetonaceae bacterium]MDW8438599.1 hypothetical protein [Chloroherpetonaceae bacterium]